MTARLTVADAAADSRRHPETVRTALQAGVLHGVQRIKRGRWLIDPECLDAWIENVPCRHKTANVVDLDQHRTTRTTA